MIYLTILQYFNNMPELTNEQTEELYLEAGLVKELHPIGNNTEWIGDSRAWGRYDKLREEFITNLSKGTSL